MNIQLISCRLDLRITFFVALFKMVDIQCFFVLLRMLILS